MSTNLNFTETLSIASSRRRLVKGLASAAKCVASLVLVFTMTTGFAAGIDLTSDNSSVEDAKATNAEPQVPYVYWTFGEIRRGDCTIAPGGTLYLYANGVTRWVCDLRSSDSGDEWDGRFEIRNSNGQVLASTPGYHFDISQENVTRHWDESRGPNPSLAAAYPQAWTISFICSC